MDAWEFWRLVEFLHCYDGATAYALAVLAKQHASPAQQPPIVHRTENGERVTEVTNAQPEHLIAAFGPDLISFGTGGGEQ